MLQADQQVVKSIEKAKHVLLTCRQDAHVDSLASCLSLYLLLEKLGVKAEVAISTPKDKIDRCSFLPKSEVIVPSGDSFQNLIIKVSAKNAELGHFRYEVEGDSLNIYVTPSRGTLNPSDVRSEIGKPPHDLIITCDTPDLESIGDLYSRHTEFFYNTPIINIDHSPGNEQYGQINFLDMTAVSTTEILFRLLQTLGDQHLDADIATAILAGMISKTESFKTASVTPRALMIASELVQRGARRDQIISNLYRQHDVSTLRLWGRVLARIKHDATRQFVWSVVTRDDFEKSGAGEDRLPGIIDELISTTPQAKTVALLYERSDGKIGGWLKTEPHISAIDLTRQWEGEGSRVLARFVLPFSSLEEAGKELAKIFNGTPLSVNHSSII